MAPSASPTDEPATPPQRSRRSFRPRFRLPALFVFAVLFCLFFAWVGRNLYEARQDEAAIEALKRAGADFDFDDSLDRSYRNVSDDLANAPYREPVRVALGLAQKPRIESVHLSVDEPHDPRARHALSALRRFPAIRRVCLHGHGFGDEALLFLKELPALDSLFLSDTNVTGAGLAQLDGSKLETLSVRTETPPEDIFAGLSTLKSLRSAAFSGSIAIDRTDMASLASLPQLDSLFLTDVRPAGDGEALMPLEKAESLTAVSLAAYEDSGEFDRFPRIPNLEEIELFGVTDEALAKWTFSPRLRRAALNPPITSDAAQAFSAGRPTCEVILYGASAHRDYSQDRYLGGERVP